MKRFSKISILLICNGLFFLSSLCSVHVFAMSNSDQSIIFHRKATNANLVWQLGAFYSTQGQQKHINIQDLVGDDFTVTKSHDRNVLIGFGYYINGINNPNYKLLYGLNAFYLPKSLVKGYVIQESNFANLKYQYSISHLPVYIAGKTIFNTNIENAKIVVDLGVGLNLLQINEFEEMSNDNNITLPDNAFSGKNRLTYSATAGIAWRINQAFNNIDMDIGYRFFYLGRGDLQKENSQFLNSLSTGNIYAHALVLTLYT